MEVETSAVAVIVSASHLKCCPVTIFSLLWKVYFRFLTVNPLHCKRHATRTRRGLVRTALSISGFSFEGENLMPRRMSAARRLTTAETRSLHTAFGTRFAFFASMYPYY